MKLLAAVGLVVAFGLWVVSYRRTDRAETPPLIDTPVNAPSSLSVVPPPSASEVLKPSGPSFVGPGVCESCHRSEHGYWMGSAHQLSAESIAGHGVSKECAQCHLPHAKQQGEGSEPNGVTCEDCHGPGSQHVVWVEASFTDEPIEDPQKGFTVILRDAAPARWVFDREAGIAKRDRQRESQLEIETCGRCHSNRTPLVADSVPRGALADTHRPALLESPAFGIDGQITGEAFEYASFLQSKMHAAGVTCSDCHNPHSLKGPEGNLLCATCHLAAKFDAPQHHFHVPGGPGSRCVDCHAPMYDPSAVHGQHDHSFRVPRPDLSVTLGTPNACNHCHADRSAIWAADVLAELYPAMSPRLPHFGLAIQAINDRVPNRSDRLAALLEDVAVPGIVRATALARWVEGSDAVPIKVLEKACLDSDPLVRAAAAYLAKWVDEDERVRLLTPLLDDPVRLVRIDAARSLGSAVEADLSPEEQRALESAQAESAAARLAGDHEPRP